MDVTPVRTADIKGCLPDKLALAAAIFMLSQKANLRLCTTSASSAFHVDVVLTGVDVIDGKSKAGFILRGRFAEGEANARQLACLGLPDAAKFEATVDLACDSGKLIIVDED